MIFQEIREANLFKLSLLHSGCFIKQDSKPACLANCCFQQWGILFLTDKIEVNGTEGSTPQPPAKSTDKGSLAPFQGSSGVCVWGGQGEVRCGWLLRLIQFSFIVQLLEVIRDKGRMKKNLEQIQLTGVPWSSRLWPCNITSTFSLISSVHISYSRRDCIGLFLSVFCCSIQCTMPGPPKTIDSHLCHEWISDTMPGLQTEIQHL